MILYNLYNMTINMYDIVKFVYNKITMSDIIQFV